MAYQPTWKERIEDAKPYFGPAIAGVIVLAVAGWLVWFSYFRAQEDRPSRALPEDEIVRLEAARHVSAEVVVREQAYRNALEQGAPEKVAAGLLERVIEKQRELIRLEPTPDPTQVEKLARLEAARGSQQARSALARSVVLEQEAVTARQASQPAVAAEKLREALQLQREANASATTADGRDLPRESRLALEIDTAAAEPLAKSVGVALTLARAAALQERWEAALAAFGEARKVQMEINRRFPSGRYADLPAVDKIDGEIESLKAASLAERGKAKEREGDAENRAGRATESAAAYALASSIQREINEKFPRSRYASTEQVEELEIRRQTTLSTVPLGRAVELDREISGLLQRRQLTAVAEKLAEASRLAEQAAAEFPRSRVLDAVLQRKLSYLALRTGDLGLLQEQVLSRLAPLPGSSNLQMLKTEMSQELYQRVMNANPSRNPGRGLPVDSVNWLEARDFCERLSWILGQRVRLPTEAEFRAVWVATEGAWSSANSDGRTREVGKSPASPGGYSDLAGNVAEWLQPAGDVGEAAPVAGGSYLDSIDTLKVLRLNLEEKRERARHIGFRIVVERVAP